MDTTMSVDLAPRGRTMIDLGGRCTAAEFKPFGCSYSTWAPPEELPVHRASYEEAEKIAASLRTRADAVALLERLGRRCYDGEKLADLRTVVQIRLHDAWFPPTFINERAARVTPRS